MNSYGPPREQQESEQVFYNSFCLMSGGLRGAKNHEQQSGPAWGALML